MTNLFFIGIGILKKELFVIQCGTNWLQMNQIKHVMVV